MTTDTTESAMPMPKPMTDERLAEIGAEYEAFGGPVEITELLAEVKRMRDAEALVQGQVDVVRRVGKAEVERAAYEAMDAERRGWEARRSVENVASADLRRERDDALGERDRLAKQVKRVREWLEGDVVTARNEFGKGYREAMRDLADLLDGTDAS